MFITQQAQKKSVADCLGGSKSGIYASRNCHSLAHNLFADPDRHVFCDSDTYDNVKRNSNLRINGDAEHRCDINSDCDRNSDSNGNSEIHIDRNSQFNPDENVHPYTQGLGS